MRLCTTYSGFLFVGIKPYHIHNSYEDMVFYVNYGENVNSLALTKDEARLLLVELEKFLCS